MGLDNIPKEYPCESKAVRNSDNQIDCKATQECGNCPYMNEYQSDPMLKDTSPVYGMLGTDCWYRGKYGNFLLEILEGNVGQFETHEYTFYGEGDDGLDTDYCFDMAKWMRDNTEQFAFNAKKYIETNQPNENVKDYINDWTYAIWWLEFVGKTSNGSAVWW